MQAFLGVLVVVLQNIRTWPQVVRILRLRDATGVSATTWSLAAASHVVWFTYGLVINDVPLIVNNLTSGLGPIAVLVAMVRHRATSVQHALSAPVLVGGLGVVLLFALGERALGAVAVGVGAAIFVPQVIKIFRTSTTGVSVVTWGLLTISSLAWVAYGIVADIPAILAAHAVVLPSAITVLTKVALDRRRTPV